MISNIVAGIGISALIFVSSISVYWYGERVPQVTDPVVALIHQKIGAPVTLDVPIQGHIFGPTYLSTKTVDSRGNIVSQTDSTEVTGGRYTVVTYSKLGVGIFNVVAVLDSQINPLKIYKQEFAIAVLYVD